MGATGTVYLVGAGPGDPGLITARGLELLRRAEVLVYDRLLKARLLAEAPPEAERGYGGRAARGAGGRGGGSARRGGRPFRGSAGDQLSHRRARLRRHPADPPRLRLVLSRRDGPGVAGPSLPNAGGAFTPRA